jgi:cell division protein FtsW (lipid II flippase)
MILFLLHLACVAAGLLMLRHASPLAPASRHADMRNIHVVCIVVATASTYVAIVVLYYLIMLQLQYILSLPCMAVVDAHTVRLGIK